MFAQRLDLSALRLTGDPVRILTRRRLRLVERYTAANSVFVGQRFTGLGRSASSGSIDGQEQEAVPTPFDIWTAALSRDGRRLALGGFGRGPRSRSRRGHAHPRRESTRAAPGHDEPGVVHDGTLLVLDGGGGGNAIRLFRFSTGTSEELFRAEPKTVNWPDWLPTGVRLCSRSVERASCSEVIALSGS